MPLNIVACKGWLQCKLIWTIFFMTFFDNFLISLLLTAPSYVDLSPGPFEDTQFDAVIDVETSDDCMDDEGITDISVKMAVRFTGKSI